MTDEWNYSDNFDLKDEIDLSKGSPQHSNETASNMKELSNSPSDKWSSENKKAFETPTSSFQRNSDNSKQVGSFPVPEPSTCIGVFGLSKRTDEQTLRETFQKFGKIKSVNLIMDKFQNVSVGYAFINYEKLESATSAVKEANGINLDDKVIRVDYSITKKAYTPTPGGYKGKIRNHDYNKNSNFQSRSTKRGYQDRQRSRSPSKSYMSSRNFDKKERDDYNNGPRYQQERFQRGRSPPRTDEYAYRNKIRPRSQNQYESVDYSPVRKVARRYSPTNIDQKRIISDRPDLSLKDHRRFSPIRSNNNVYDHIDYRKHSDRMDNRRYSPHWAENARASPVGSRRESPYRSSYRKNSPADNRMYSNQTVSRKYSADRYDGRKYYPRDTEMRRSPPQMSDLRRMSPPDVRSLKRFDNERVSMMKYDSRKLSPRPVSRRYSPSRLDEKRQSMGKFDNEKRSFSGFRKVSPEHRNIDRSSNDIRKFSHNSNRRDNAMDRKYVKENNGNQNYVTAAARSSYHDDMSMKSRKY